MIAARLTNLTVSDSAKIKHDGTANLQSLIRAEAAKHFQCFRMHRQYSKSLINQKIDEQETPRQQQLTVQAAQSEHWLHKKRVAHPQVLPFKKTGITYYHDYIYQLNQLST